MLRKNKTPSAGGLDERIDVQTAVRVPDGFGGFTESFGVASQIWARVVVLKARDEDIANGERLVTTYAITARNAGAFALLTTDDKLTWRGRTLDIIGVDPVGRDQYKRVTAREGVV